MRYRRQRWKAHEVVHHVDTPMNLACVSKLLKCDHTMTPSQGSSLNIYLFTSTVLYVCNSVTPFGASLAALR